MSPIRPGSARRSVSAKELDAVTQALTDALASGGQQLPEDHREAALDVIGHVRSRSSIAGDHTVAALAGATGSGKSSLFNALVGAEVATPGVRRPTTTSSTAAVWGGSDARELLDWLSVSHEYQVPATPEQRAAGSLDGLVVIDLPDFDSVNLENRAEAERLLALVDVFVWVTDPQKYADAKLHDEFVAQLSSHGATTIVVLNQSDRLTADQTEACVGDLTRLMRHDGITGAEIIATSTKTGAGIDEVRQRLANAVAAGQAARFRMAGDIRGAAKTLLGDVASDDPSLDKADTGRLTSALARAAGVPVVVRAVDRDYRMRAAQRTGWPPTRWVHRLRPRPLRRLRLDAGTADGSDGSLARSSLPAASPAAKADVVLATRRVVDQPAAKLPPAWIEAVDSALNPEGFDIADSLDQAVLATRVEPARPRWWGFVSFLQYLLLATALVGFGWLIARAVIAWLGFDLSLSAPPTWGPLPVPFVLLVGGLGGGLLLAFIARVFARWGGRRAARRVERALKEAISQVASRDILEPVSAVLSRHAKTRAALMAAAGER